MSLAQSGMTDYYEGMVYNYNGTLSYRNSSNTGVGKTSYREPSLITNNANDGYTWNVSELIGAIYDAEQANYKTILGFNSPSEYGTYLANSYNNMVTSVDTYGGFYVGRYETTMAGSGSNVIVGTKANSTVMASNNWYKMQLYQDSTRYASNPYNGTNSVATSMMWGSQWDTMLNFILEGSDKEKVTAVTGNHTGTRSITGQFGSDIMNNIFDLSSNVREWTTEAYGATSRTYRGGHYSVDNVNPASKRDNNNPTRTNSNIGSRLSL